MIHAKAIQREIDGIRTECEGLLMGESRHRVALAHFVAAIDNRLQAIEVRLDDDEEEAEERLPEVQRIPGKKPQRVDPTIVACDRCGAKRGTPCFKMSSRGPAGVPLPEPYKSKAGTQSHKVRNNAARAMFGLPPVK